MPRPSRNTRSRGSFGEAAALRVLQQHGYDILARNWRHGHAEIDIVAREGNTIVFVEVKLRRNSRFGAPEESVNAAKIGRTAEAGQQYLVEHSMPEADWRIDVVAIEMSTSRIDTVRLIQGIGL